MAGQPPECRLSEGACLAHPIPESNDRGYWVVLAMRLNENLEYRGAVAVVFSDRHSADEAAAVFHCCTYITAVEVMSRGDLDELGSRLSDGG